MMVAKRDDDSRIVGNERHVCKSHCDHGDGLFHGLKPEPERDAENHCENQDESIDDGDYQHHKGKHDASTTMTTILMLTIKVFICIVIIVLVVMMMGRYLCQ